MNTQVLLDHRVQSGDLLGLVVAVHRCLLHEVTELRFRWLPAQADPVSHDRFTSSSYSMVRS